MDYVFQHSWQFLIIIMNQPWMVSVGNWERKSTRNLHFQYSAAKDIKQAFTQTIKVTLKGISLSRWTKFYPERSIKLGSGVGGRERIRALCGEGLCVPYINEKKKSCLWQKANNLLSFSLLDVCYPTIKSAGSISFPIDYCPVIEMHVFFFWKVID